MKLLPLVLALFTLPAFAANEKAQPVRMAHVKGVVNQYATGDFEPKQLCELDGDAPVYESLEIGKGLQPFDKVCDVKFGGKQMRVQISAMFYYTDAKEDKVRRKVLQTTMFVFEKENGQMYYSQTVAASSTDLTVRSLETFLSAGQYEGNNFPKSYASFGFSVDGTDDQQ